MAQTHLSISVHKVGLFDKMNAKFTQMNLGAA
jgi:hypothetical protein